MDIAINEPGHRSIVVYGLNATGKRYLKDQVEPQGKLVSNESSNIGMLTIASKNVFNNFAENVYKFSLIITG